MKRSYNRCIYGTKSHIPRCTCCDHSRDPRKKKSGRVVAGGGGVAVNKGRSASMVANPTLFYSHKNPDLEDAQEFPIEPSYDYEEDDDGECCVHYDAHRPNGHEGGEDEWEDVEDGAAEEGITQTADEENTVDLLQLASAQRKAALLLARALGQQYQRNRRKQLYRDEQRREEKEEGLLPDSWMKKHIFEVNVAESDREEEGSDDEDASPYFVRYLSSSEMMRADGRDGARDGEGEACTLDLTLAIPMDCWGHLLSFLHPADFGHFLAVNNRFAHLLAEQTTIFEYFCTVYVPQPNDKLAVCSPRLLHLGSHRTEEERLGAWKAQKRAGQLLLWHRSPRAGRKKNAHASYPPLLFAWSSYWSFRVQRLEACLSFFDKTDAQERIFNRWNYTYSTASDQHIQKEMLASVLRQLNLAKAECWFELFLHTSSSPKREFARIKTNEYAAMLATASNLAEVFQHWDKVPRRYRVEGRPPKEETWPARVRDYLSSLRLRSLDVLDEEEFDIAARGEEMIRQCEAEELLAATAAEGEEAMTGSGQNGEEAVEGGIAIPCYVFHPPHEGFWMSRLSIPSRVGGSSRASKHLATKEYRQEAHERQPNTPTKGFAETDQMPTREEEEAVKAQQWKRMAEWQQWLRMRKEKRMKTTRKQLRTLGPEFVPQGTRIRKAKPGSKIGIARDRLQRLNEMIPEDAAGQHLHWLGEEKYLNACDFVGTRFGRGWDNSDIYLNASLYNSALKELRQQTRTGKRFSKKGLPPKRF